MSHIKFSRGQVERFGKARKCLNVNRNTLVVGWIYKANANEHDKAPCWVLEYVSGRRDYHESQESARSDALKIY